ncbi:sigma-54 interaction domain-containing protein [Haliovirga abyssi]|uniref:Fis family transcriptional regulator n=1 Tax=Haliovirga abyssi TaxID=2996794 RepID=A0AAU9DKD6_9FUSO|nr:sigma 54-interacting transcriptional regulator [Haliovirga abyssi]BDU50352.1 Fis family transcriptional regulator [Haliovirga abyssi]
MDISKKILNSISEGVFTINDEWKITSFNKAAEKITGYKREEVMGKYCKNIFKSNKCSKGCPMLEVIEYDEPKEEKSEMNIIDKAGKIVPIRVKNYSLKNSVGETIGGIELFEDIREIIELKKRLNEEKTIIRESDKMEKIIELANVASKSDSTILITGETGTGKEVIANYIYKNSERKNRPFIKLNCAALPGSVLESELFGYEKGAFTGAVKTKKGYFELADKGTIFLDEIGELEYGFQAKLLRVLQEGEFYRIGGEKLVKVDIRIIAATNKDLKKEVVEKKFREDLYYRLNIFNLHMPALRDRKEDILPLVYSFINKFKVKFEKNIMGISKDALNVLVNYSYPGNIRELENIIEHSFIVAKNNMIMVGDWPNNLVENKSIKNNVENEIKQNDKLVELNENIEIKPLDEFEKEYILGVLKKFEGNKAKTARELKIDIKKLYRRLEKWRKNSQNGM